MWLLLLAAGSAAQDALPEGAFVLPGSTVPAMLRQCSRSAPRAGEGTWQPQARDIAALEAALPARLAGRPPRNYRPEGWTRQYVGIVRDGRRFIYGNFFPRWNPDDAEIARWRTRPVIVCDGGSSLFGVEYDVEAGRITHLGYNGFP